MMKGLFSCLLLALTGVTALSGSAAAQSCYDLWYERNAVYNAYGYCFTTSLGQRVFDNSDCTTSSPNLSRVDKRYVERIQREERRRGCRVNR